MRLKNLEGLRGVACLLVVAFHVAHSEQLQGPRSFLAPVLHFGYGAVDLFFILSGFVMTWANYDHLGDRDRLWRYLSRRAERIYPVYFACWLTAFPIMFGWGVTKYWLHNLRAFPGWPWVLLVRINVENTIIPQAWTLNCEVAFYAAFAAFFLLPRGAFLPVITAWLLGVVGAAAAGITKDSLYHSGVAAMFGGHLICPQAAEFSLGCLGAYALRRGCRAWGRTALALGLAGFAAGGAADALGFLHAKHGPSQVLQFGVPLAFIMYGAAAVERSRGWALPNWLQAVGTASYPIYLIHIAVIRVAETYLADLWHREGLVTATFAASLTAGFAIHFLIERPLLNRRRNRPALAAAPVTLRRAA